MGRFHDELVAARQRGETLVPAAAPDPLPEAREEAILVNFYPAPFEGLSTCGRCLALVVTQYTPTHADWHQQNGH